MFRNHLKSTVRKLVKDKRYTVINIVGLSSGLVLFLTIALYVQRELAVDNYHTNSEHIYRVNATFSGENGETETYASTYQPLAKAMREEIPGVEAVTNFFSPAAQFSFRSGDQMHSVDNTSIYYTDNQFFEVFTVDWADEGNRLDEPNTAVISEELAVRFFGEDDPVGKTLTYEDSRQKLSLIVSGIFETSDRPSHIQYDMLINDQSAINFWRNGLDNNWDFIYVYTYLKGSANIDPMAINEGLVQLRKKYQPQRETLAYSSQGLKDIYWNPALFEPGVNGNMAYIYVFGTFALVVLVLAAVNFINLMTARSIRRSKEVAIRKIVGASRKGLILQYLSESKVLAMIAMVLAGFSVERLIPLINANFDLAISFNLFNNPTLLAIVVLTPFALGLLSGIYPALVLSNFKAGNLLQGKSSWDFSHQALRKGLLVFQFLISVLVISGVMVINQQMRYVQNQGLGFTEDPIIVLPRINNNSNYLIRQELKNEPGIEGIASLSSIPGYRDPRGRNIKEINTTGEGIAANGIWVSEDYAPMLDLEFIAGRNFTLTDHENAIIINEKTLSGLGWTVEEALAKSIVMTGRDGFDPTPYNVVGVIKDYNYQSLYEEVEPLFLKNNSKSRRGGDASIVKLSASRFDEVLSAIELVWSEIETSEAFSYYFLDDALNDVYQKEVKLSKTVAYVSGISMLICFMGLYGLVSLTLQSRKKEIGIRKVLGATGKIIAQLLSSSYAKMIGLSVLIGLPVSYYFLEKWLSNFVYRVDYSFGLYLVVGVGLLLLSVLLISGQSIQAAKSNPVDSLRED